LLNIFDIKDRCYLITGASSGIGRNLSILLNEAGAKLLLTGRNIEKLNETHDMLKYKDNAVIESVDLSDVKNIKDWVRNFISKHNVLLNGFVHCAGVSIVKPLAVVEQKDFVDILQINLIAGMELLKSVANPKYSVRGSSFVFVSSVAGLMGEPGMLCYGASKAALINSVKTVALELARYKYRVNTIAPGMVKTPILDAYKGLEEDQIKAIESKFPLGTGEPSDVSNAILFLLSDASKWITGTTIVVDGGYSAGK